MTTSYTGNPVGVQAPDSAPTLGKAPVLTLPVDGEADNVSSIYQAFKDLADHVAFNATLAPKLPEVPSWSDLLSHCKDSSGVGYSNAFDGTWAPLGSTAFTKGRGLILSPSGLVVTIKAGFLGTVPGVLTPPSLATPSVPNVRWATVLNGFFAPSVQAAAGGQFRYSLITASVDPDLTPLFSVTNGVSATNPSVPAIPAGQALIALTKQSPSAITELFDCTMPAGPLSTNMIFPATAGICGDPLSLGTGWVPETGLAAGGMKQVLPGNQKLVIPICGDSSERLAQVEIVHLLGPGSKIELIRFSGWADVFSGLCSLDPVRESLAGVNYTADNTKRTFTLYGSLTFTMRPVWGHGAHIKAEDPGPYALALLITGTSILDGVRSVRTYTVKS